MNHKDKEHDIETDGHDVDDNEELHKCAVEFEWQEVSPFPSDSLDADDAKDLPGDEPARSNSELAKPYSEPQEPAVIKKAKRPQENNNSCSTAHSSMPTPQVDYDGLRQETAFNNMIAGNIQSHERRADA